MRKDKNKNKKKKPVRHLLWHYISVGLTHTIHKCQTDTWMTAMKSDERVNQSVCLWLRWSCGVWLSALRLLCVHQSPINWQPSEQERSWMLSFPFMYFKYHIQQLQLGQSTRVFHFVQRVKWSNRATAIRNVLLLCFAIVFIDDVINCVLAFLICSSTDEQFRWNAQGRLNV